MIRIANKSDCTGCTACESICPKCAITMEADEQGFLYPFVDENKCIHCKLCIKSCPVVNYIDYDVTENPLQSYAAYCKDDAIRERSTSGGFFTVLAKEIILRKGIVYAARFDDSFKIVHDGFNSVDEIDAYRGSKYAQSDLHGVFRRIKIDLLENKTVLFVGTPCQVAGLKRFLKKVYPGLYTCDFICMCISSPMVWKDYLQAYHSDSKIKRIFFKDKREGWHNWKMLVHKNNGSYLCKGREDPFFRSYLSHLSIRPSCFNCKFRKLKHVSDFTISDCWGINKYMPAFDDNKGCTTIMIQSEKGKEMFGIIKDELETHTYPTDYIRQFNPYSVMSIKKNINYDIFWKTYVTEGAKIALEKNYMLQSSNNGICGKIVKLFNMVFK